MAHRQATDKGWAHATHDRWKQRIGQHPGSHYRSTDEETRLRQCGSCTFYIKLERGTPLAYDWGVCSCPDSPLDGQVAFEHDGCDAYQEAPGGWA